MTEGITNGALYQKQNSKLLEQFGVWTLKIWNLKLGNW
jgi:hypothetical protein